MTILPIAHRPFACDKCGCMHLIETNHEGQVYGQKCRNWPCTSGRFQTTSMTYWGGDFGMAYASHDAYSARGNVGKAIMPFKQGVNLLEQSNGENP